MSQTQAGAQSTGSLVMRRGGRWREDIWDRVLREADKPECAPGTPAGRHLAAAAEYANASWTKWWWDPGSQVEACWRELRLADEATLTWLAANNPALLKLRAADIARRAGQAYGSSSGQVQELRELAKGDAEPAPAVVPKLADRATALLVRLHQGSDQKMRNLRSLRNQLRFLASLLAGLAVATVIALAILDWKVLPAPGGIAPWGAVALAMVAGLLGALFSAIPSLAAIPEKSMVFNPIREQALLKLAVGAWSAVFGLAAVSAGLGPSTAQAGSGTANAEVTSLAGFIMVAALFGAGQEALTRFADRKATDVRDSAPTAGSATPAAPQ